MALIFSIGIGFNLKGSLQISDVMNPLMVAVILLGILAGITPFFLPLVLLAPFIFSLKVHIPLKSLVSENQTLLGTLHFFPSNEGSLTIDWTDAENREHVLFMEGESAAVVIQRNTIPTYLFFLESQTIPLGILSRQVSISELPEEDTSWFKSFHSETGSDSPLYSISFPALKYYTPGFFNRIMIYVRHGDLIQESQ